MKILLLYNMHTNESNLTKVVVDALSREGYECYKLSGYFKHPLGSEPEKFVNSLNEVKEKGAKYDLIIDIHGSIIFPSIKYKQLFEQKLYASNALFPCLFIVYCEEVFNLLKKDLDHIWDNETLFKRLLRRNWTRAVLDKINADLIEKLGLERKYIEYEVEDTKVAIIVLKTWLEGINENYYSFNL